MDYCERNEYGERLQVYMYMPLASHDNVTRQRNYDFSEFKLILRIDASMSDPSHLICDALFENECTPLSFYLTFIIMPLCCISLVELYSA